MLPRDPSKHAEYILKLKNKNFTPEHRKNLSKALIGNQRAKGKKWSKPSPRKGQPLPVSTKIAISKAHIGKIHSSESKTKMSISHLGLSPWNKGKPMNEETKKKLSISKQNPSPETRFRLGKGMRGKKRPPFSTQWRQRMRDARKSIIIPKKDTKPERMMQLALSLHGIKFEKHKAIIGQPDIFIEPNICVFVDGDYWHRLPKALLRDAEVNHELNLLGYQVIRIWEREIKKDVNNCAMNVIKLIQKIRGNIFAS